MSASIVAGRLVLADGVVPGRVHVRDGAIEAVRALPDATLDDDAPLIAPGFVDVHVHGFGGHDALGDEAALDGMARALAARGVTAFLPTAVARPLDELHAFADRVRAWLPAAPSDGAVPLGFDLEGPFLATSRHGGHDPAHLRQPADVAPEALAPLVDGLRVTTVAPELPGALELIARLAGAGVAVALGHSEATLDEARAGYAAGARSTTHLWNAMSGVHHRTPGLAVAALTTDEAWVELIADGHHVHPALWPIAFRAKPPERIVLVSDSLAVGGTDAARGTSGALPIEVRDGRAVLAGTDTLAGSIIALDDAVRALVAHGTPLHVAVAAASAAPAALLGDATRGRLEAGRRADLVELDADLGVRRVMLGGRWLD